MLEDEGDLVAVSGTLHTQHLMPMPSDSSRTKPFTSDREMGEFETAYSEIPYLVGPQPATEWKHVLLLSSNKDEW